MNPGAVILSRSGIPTVSDFSNATGAPIVGDILTGILYWLGAAQNPFPINPTNIQGLGAVGDGITDNTAKFAAAIAGLPANGGEIYVPYGTYLTDVIEMPDWPKNVTVRCEAGVIFMAKNANTPIFKGCASVAPIVGTGTYNILGFPIFKAYASGSTGPAIDLRNWSYSSLEIGGFLPNGAGTWTDGLFFSASGGKHCYANRVEPGMQCRNSTPVSRSFIRVEGNANRHYVGTIIAVATASPKLVSFSDGENISDWTIDQPYCEGWTGTSPSVIDVGDGNLAIYVLRPYFEDVIKAFDETATSECFIYDGKFAQSPGVSQGTQLGTNYKRLGNPSGGANTCNNIDALNGLWFTGSGAIRFYDATNTSFWTLSAFDGIKIEVNYPFNTTESYRVDDIKVVGNRVTGWTNQTAAASRADLGAAPTVNALASAFSALYADLKAHGLIGT